MNKLNPSEMVLSRSDSSKGWIDPGSSIGWIFRSFTHDLPHIPIQPCSLRHLSSGSHRPTSFLMTFLKQTEACPILFKLKINKIHSSLAIIYSSLSLLSFLKVFLHLPSLLLTSPSPHCNLISSPPFQSLQRPLCFQTQQTHPSLLFDQPAPAELIRHSPLHCHDITTQAP